MWHSCELMQGMLVWGALCGCTEDCRKLTLKTEGVSLLLPMDMLTLLLQSQQLCNKPRKSISIRHYQSIVHARVTWISAISPPTHVCFVSSGKKQALTIKLVWNKLVCCIQSHIIKIIRWLRRIFMRLLGTPDTHLTDDYISNKQTNKQTYLISQS